MATEQELKPALNPFVQSLLNLQGGGLEGLLQGINPSLENDPVFQNLKKVGSFVKTTAEDPLTYIGGGGPKLASAYLVARAKKMEDVKKLQKTIKREETNITSSTDPNEIQGATRAVANARKKLKTLVDSIRKSDAKEGVKAGKKPVADASSSTGRSPAIITKDSGEGLASLINEGDLFHGSTKRLLDELILPQPSHKGANYLKKSTGGTYTTTMPDDPRVRDFAKGMKRFQNAVALGRPPGSIYQLQPELQRTLDVQNIPKNTRNLLQKKLDIDDFERIGDGFSQELDPAVILSHILKDTKGGGLHAPAYFTKGVGDLFKELDYDSIKFAARPNQKTFSDTIISLDPKENLKIIDEIAEPDLDDFIRAYFSGK
jgi:hypothetical protein